MKLVQTILLSLALLCTLPHRLSAQQGHLQGTEEWNYLERKKLNIAGQSRQAAVLPILEKDLISDTLTEFLHAVKGRRNNAFERLYNFEMGKIGNDKNHIIITPTIDFEAGLNSRTSGATGGGAVGLNVTADLGKQFSFGGYGRFSQYSFPDYLEHEISRLHVSPACGYAVQSSLGGHYFWDWDVYANYSFMKYFNLEAGMGRNFWGDGYRSFFLSDQSFSYPYIKLTTSVWHIKYINLYAQLKDLRNSNTGIWSRMDNKYGSFHFLTWDVSKRVNIGFFEAIIWQNADSSMRRGFDINYLNPLIFYRPVEFSIGSPDNSLMGFSAKVKVGKKSFFYGQFMLDDIIWGEFSSGSINRIKHWLHPGDSVGNYGYWTNKQAWQLGFTSYDIFKIKGLDIQIEYNAARPYTFSHRRPEVNYTHYNEPLAHPAGANFHEILGFIKYSYKKYFFQCEGRYLLNGLDTNGTHYGSNILQPTFDTYYPEYQNIPVQQYGNSIGQGLKCQTFLLSIKATRMIIPSLNLRAEAMLMFRQQQTSLSTQRGIYFSVGIKSSWFHPSIDR